MLKVKDLITKLLDFNMESDIYLHKYGEQILDDLNIVYKDTEGDIILSSDLKPQKFRSD